MATTVREASGDGTDSEGEGRHLSVRPDGDVGYYDSGRGEAILLAHAGVFSDWFRPLSLQLPRDRFRVVRLRRAGYRGSASPSGHLTIADHARHAAVLLDELRIGAAHWVGHSSSCLIGQLAWLVTAFTGTVPRPAPAPGETAVSPA